MKYGIGLDIGITSVGWAAIGLNDEEEPCGIINLGSRIFKQAEHPKTGESLAAPRREARGIRRRLRRKAFRKERIYALLPQFGLPDKAAMEEVYKQSELEDIYALRTRALDGAVSKEEFARILLHLAQRRGFRSNRKFSAADDKEAGLLKSAVSDNAARMEQNGYRTVGEMFYKDELYQAQKRNKGKKYISTVSRDMVQNEAVTLFNAQRSFGSQWAAPELEAEYLTILLSQRSFDEGPGGNSPYGGHQIEKMIGKCTLLPDEQRAAKACYSFEYFNLLEKVNHVRITAEGNSRALTEEERRAVVHKAHQTEALHYGTLRKVLALDDSERFNMVSYRSETDRDEAEKKAKFQYLKGYHAMRRALNKVKPNRIEELTTAQRNKIGEIFTKYKNEERLRSALEQSDLTQPDIDALLNGLGGFSKFGHLSCKACDDVIPYLEQGMVYSDACTAAGYQFKGHTDGDKFFLLPSGTQDERIIGDNEQLRSAAQMMDTVTSPVVRRAVSQTIKVINAIIREQGESPVYINIELARELSKTHDERDKIQKSMEENAAQNELLRQEMVEAGYLNPQGYDIMKFRLWKEQDGRCAYSGAHMGIDRVLSDPTYVDIDHIVPYSISFDDRRVNKVLVLSGENRQKGNRLPLQYLQGKRREDFIVWVKNSKALNYHKKQLLLKETISEEEKSSLKQRNLQDTQHMARFLQNYIRDFLQFAPGDRKQRVTAVAGAVTAHLRARNGLTKVRANGDTHHALDAVVIGTTTQGVIQKISSYYGHIEEKYTQSEDGSFAEHSRTKERFPAPWPHFRDEVIIRLSDKPTEGLMQCNPMFYTQLGRDKVRPVFVSRMPRRSTHGPAHDATVMRLRVDEQSGERFAVKKVPLTALKLKNGEIEDYYKRESDTLLYNALLRKLNEAGGDAKKAFADDFYKPKADGSQGPLVKKVKIETSSTRQVPVHGGAGIAERGTMLRVDVFYVPNEGYYWIPIYVADTWRPYLKSKAVKAHKPEAEWKEMREEDFIFSLYPDDLICVESKKQLNFTAPTGSTLEKEYTPKKEFIYFSQANIANASFSGSTHDNAYKTEDFGVKNLVSLQKCEVDILGNVHFVTKKEKRQTFR